MKWNVNDRLSDPDVAQRFHPNADQQPAAYKPDEQSDNEYPGRIRSTAELEAENEALRAELTQSAVDPR